MAAQYKTKCPHCGAQFKISQEHLKQAGGRVRCGSCLEVFQATDHLVPEKPAQPAAGKAPAKKPPAKKPAAKKPAAKKPAPAQKNKAADDEPKWTLPGGDKEEKKTSTEDLLEKNDTAVSLGESELSDSFMSLDEEGNDFGAEDFSDMSGSAGGQASSADESWAEELLEELGGEDEEEDHREPVTPDNMSLLDEFDGSAADVEYEEHAEPAADAEDLDFFREEFDSFGEEPDEIEAIEIPRVEEEEEKKPHIPRPAASSSPMEMLKWGLLSLVAALALGAQYLVFHFHDLARTPAWRPLYSSVCSVAGCELPNPSDVSRLRGTNLVVRDHPSVPGALVVDAILFNTADYPQPFPVLELSFSTLNGRAVASRRFAPDEYRAGDLDQLERMPPDVPVHVSFEILDPGEQAVNYNLRFFPAPAPGNA